MSMFRIFDVAGSAVSAQSQRLNVVASNLANADTVAGPDGQAYKARQVVFQTVLMGSRDQPEGAAGVRVSTVREDAGTRPPRARPQAPQRRRRRLRDLQQRQLGGGDGQHDLRLAFVPEQHRSDEHRPQPAAEDAADGPAGLIRGGP
jgi:flagellar basal body rod protein FlgB